MKNLIILGSTGSIGTQTLDVVREHPDLFHVSVLVANRSDELLEKQIEEFQPELAVLSDEIAYGRLKERYQGRTELAGGRRAVIEAAAYPAGDVVVTSLMGFAGLEPTMAALEAGKDIAWPTRKLWWWQVSWSWQRPGSWAGLSCLWTASIVPCSSACRGRMPLLWKG